jgi:predicted AAA+ superfamily ATPase
MTEQIKSAKKVYLSDNGFLNLGINRSLNYGTSLENCVFVILNNICDEVTYIKENYEIDFKCSDTLYQVSYKMEDEKTRTRELRAFGSFDSDSSYNNKLITYDESSSFEGVEIMSLEDFVFGLENNKESGR